MDEPDVYSEAEFWARWDRDAFEDQARGTHLSRREDRERFESQEQPVPGAGSPHPSHRAA